MIGFHNREEKCLQRGTDWVFKQSSLRFVFTGLKVNIVIGYSGVLAFYCSKQLCVTTSGRARLL